MKSSDYIASFLVKHGISECYGYQGTMIAHLVDSICNTEGLHNHCCYNEQAAAFAAVSEAKVTGKLAFAYSTSGPGAINLMSGIADAYYDSAPVLFITGQLNSYEYLSIKGIRQNGFQECDVVSMVKPIVKYCAKVEHIEDLRKILEEACYWATEGRHGPVLIDLPMDMQRQDIDPEEMESFHEPTQMLQSNQYLDAVYEVINELEHAQRPVLILGNGVIKDNSKRSIIKKMIDQLQIPVITSILGRDILEYENPYNFGFLGSAYGHRYANLIVNKKCDLIIAIGCSLCKRQTGMNTYHFAENAKIIRVDIDPLEIKREVHKDDIIYQLDCNEFLSYFDKALDEHEVKDYSQWIEVCRYIKNKLEEFDDSCELRVPNKIVSIISDNINPKIICSDVGQHQMWVAQSYHLKKGQRLLFSGGHGAMGFSLPAAIGASCKTHDKAIVIAGDGSIQMNIQELQWVFREKLPITIFVFNNSSLGLIQQQQDDIFEGRYYGSVASGGYLAPNFSKIAKAYGIASMKVEKIDNLEYILKDLNDNEPHLIEIMVDTKSRAAPKTYFGEEMHNQKPYVPEELLTDLLNK